MALAIGSDNVGDSSVLEAEHLQSLGLVDEMALLKIWAEDTPRSIFPQRRIGFLREGYEASFLALEGNPLEDWRNIRRIKLRFKQGVEVHPSDDDRIAGGPFASRISVAVTRLAIEPGSPPFTEAVNIAGIWGPLSVLIIFSLLPEHDARGDSRANVLT